MWEELLSNLKYLQSTLIIESHVLAKCLLCAFIFPRIIRKQETTDPDVQLNLNSLLYYRPTVSSYEVALVCWTNGETELPSIT